jgi:hypothetical protein
MKDFRHIFFIAFLVFVSLTAVFVLSLLGWGYYFTPLEMRPFRADYITMKPSGYYSHGLGIIGSLMVIIGVAMYSSRKRMRVLWNIGKLTHWLEVHIFLCLSGPILIVYHTTFKAGGIAAISLWTMLSIVASGLIGRFLYIQIPRNLNGSELTMDEINNEMQRLGKILKSYPLGILLSTIIDKSFANLHMPTTLLGTFTTIVRLERIKIQTRANIREVLSLNNLSPEVGSQLQTAALARAALTQKSLVLNQIERLFFIWHAIHLPFTIIMFITLATHVTVGILLGYRWIF